jgi:hypothetical protein
MTIEIRYEEDNGKEETVVPRALSLESAKEEIKKVLEDYCGKLAQGNEGYARVEELELNGTQLKASILIRHKHKSGRPFNVTVYAAKTYLKLDTDVLHPDADDLKACIDSPVGQICITLEDVFKLIATFLV